MVKITLNVEGMMCPRCEAHMNATVSSELKVSKVTSSHADRQTVIIANDDIDDTRLEQVTAKAGYKLTGVSREEYRRKLFG